MKLFAALALLALALFSVGCIAPTSSAGSEDAPDAGALEGLPEIPTDGGYRPVLCYVPAERRAYEGCFGDPPSVVLSSDELTTIVAPGITWIGGSCTADSQGLKRATCPRGMPCVVTEQYSTATGTCL